MTERLKQAIKETGIAVDEVINRLIPKSNEMESQLFDAMRYCTLEGGKRMRPADGVDVVRDFQRRL